MSAATVEHAHDELGVTERDIAEAAVNAVHARLTACLAGRSFDTRTDHISVHLPDTTPATQKLLDAVANVTGRRWR